MISIFMLFFSPKMKVLRSFACFFTLLLFFTAKAQEPVVEFLHLHDPTAPSPPGHYKPPMAVQVQSEHLSDVSSSVLTAESWLKTHVLAHYPRVNVTTILAGHSVLCSGDAKHRRSLGLVLPSVKNIHHSLIRWGLENEIKATTSFSDSCLDSGSKGYYHYRDDLAEVYIKPLLLTLKEMNSPYVLSPNLNSTLSALKSHYEAMKNLGDLHLVKKIVAIAETPREPKPFARKLSSFTDSDAKTPLPPLLGTIIPPQPSFTAPSHAPEPTIKSPPLLPPTAANPSSPPPHLPPCQPQPVHDRGGVWCVAKPSVPTETLQLALDFACGEGGADCEAIQPRGSCFFPDNVLAHASYAFNSYWQRAKKRGGSCGFSGTAMLLNSDPSYGGCRFLLA